MKVFAIVGFLLMAIGCFGQSLEGKFSPKPSEKQVWLYENIGSKHTKLDSATIDQEGHYQFTKTYPLGFYLVVLNEGNKFAIILNPNEKEVKIDFKAVGGRYDETIVASQENQLLFDYKTRGLKILEEFQILQAQAELAPDDDELINAIQAKQDSLLLSQGGTHQRLMERAPDSYFSKTLRQSEAPHNALPETYLNDIDFADSSLLRSSVFPRRMMEFLEQYTGNSEESFRTSIDLILSKAKANDQVYAFSINFLLDLFQEIDARYFFQYVTETYVLAEGCSDIPLDDAIARMTDGYRLLMPGNKAPDFSAPNPKGRQVSLKSIAAKNDYVVLFFWASHCHFCEKEMPELKEVYQQYKNKKVAIIAISSDEDVTAWKNAIVEKDLPWTHVSDLKGWKSTPLQLYKVHQTPTFFLLDGDMNIVARPKGPSELSTELGKLTSKK